MKTVNRSDLGTIPDLPLRVLQFGGGNFLRGFVDWMIQILNEETEFNAGVVIVKPTGHGDYGILQSQDGLFTVLLEGVEKGETKTQKKLVTCVQRIVNPYSEWEAYLKLAEVDTLRFIVSNTTEAGIQFNASDTLTDLPPKEFPAKLTLWLYHRFQFFQGDLSKGCIFLPCELIEDNGETLKKTILRYADHWLLGENFKSWIQNANHFCNTLVDRSVSGFPTEQGPAIQQELGYRDPLLVAGEYYHSWVLEGPQMVREELPFGQTDLNVEFVDSLAPYRLRKVRILNGAHTVMVPLSLLHGLLTVKESIDDRFTGSFVSETLFKEILPVLQMDKDSLNAFAYAVLDRFRNPSIKHQLSSIALNSVSKFKVRVLPSMLDHIHLAKKLPKNLVFAFACLIRFYKGTWSGKTLPVNDDPDFVLFFQKVWSTDDFLEIAHTVLQNTALWGEDLTQINGLPEAIAKALTEIEANGIENGFNKFSV